MHLDLEIPRDIAAGATAVIERRDDLVELASGAVEVNSRWRASRRRYEIGYALKTAADLESVVAIFEAARGRLHTFRMRDWADWRSAPPDQAIAATDQPLGADDGAGGYTEASGDGATASFQLVKRYGVLNGYLRPIALPVAGTVVAAVDGAATTAFSLTVPGGTITFDTPPAAGTALTAGFEFDVPVRFEAAELGVEWIYFLEGEEGSARAPSIGLVEARLDGGGA